MNIMLTGATMESNFGDFLFAKIFWDAISDLVGKENTYFYDSYFTMFDFFKKNLGYNKKSRMTSMDALIYISGGYFCGDDKNIKDYILRFFRYFYVGLYFSFAKKPIAVIGMDIGKIEHRFLRICAKRILKSAKIISVRNEESVQYLKKYGIHTPYCLTSDTAQVLDERFGKSHPLKLENDEKYLFFHIFTNITKNKSTVYKLIPAIEKFLNDNPDYKLVVGCDQYEEFEDDILADINESLNCKAILYKYENPLELFSLLNSMDYIITPKLHVGIVGCTLGKSVLSFSVHTDKIERYYKQIGEADRSVALSDCNIDMVIRKLERYKNIKVKLDDKIKKAALNNLEILKEFLMDLKE